MDKDAKLKIEYMPVDKLKPYEKNARKHANIDVNAIAASIERFGFDDPIGVWSDKNIIVEGHGRLMAAKKLGMKEVPVIRLDHLSDEERRAYALAHNKTAELSSWDLDTLDSELDELGKMFDMDEFGFPSEEQTDDGGLSEKYSDKIGEVIYEPKNTNWKIQDLFEERSFDKEIEAATSNEELRRMLKLRAAIFTDLNFARIADYYAYQATEKEQDIFEKLGLVLLDKDQLIERGFADLIETVDNDDGWEG